MRTSQKDTCVLAIDQGTQSTRAALFSTRGEMLALERAHVSLRRFQDGRIEQDGQEVLDSVLNTIDRVQSAGFDGIAAAGLATQRSSVVAWNRHTGLPISPVISWQDTRGRSFLERLDAPTRSQIQSRSGLPVSAHYGATKLKWLTQQPDVARSMASGDCVMGPLAAFLLANLVASSDGPLVDYANGGRMQLMNHVTLLWDHLLLKLFGISKDMLPALRPNESNYGELRGTSVPLVVVHGDQTAAIHAYGGLVPGIAHVNLGTGGFVMVAEPQGYERDERFLRSIAASNADSSTFVIEGTVNGAGAALQWADERLGGSRVYSAENMDEWLGQEPTPIIFLNCVGGLGSPIWSPAGCFDWENVWVDLSGRPVANPVWLSAMCAVAESILFLTNINLGCMQGMGCCIGRIRVSGGLSRSDIFLQRLANLSGCEVDRAVDVEATMYGVARMASHWLAETPEVWPEPSIGRVIQPMESADSAHLRQRYAIFCDLIERAN